MIDEVFALVAPKKNSLTPVHWFIPKVEAGMFTTRRNFLSSVGTGMLVGALGRMEFDPMGKFAGTESWLADERLTFGPLEPLVDLMQMTPPEKLIPELVSRMKKGVDLKTLTAAASLANARRFGGEDYIGYHTFMALAPAFSIAQQLPGHEAALPVLKVIFRNAERIQADGGGDHDHLHLLELEGGQTGAESPSLTEQIRSKDLAQAERTISALASRDIGEAYNHLQFAIQDEIDVHRVVLPWRAWVTLDLAGQEHAATLLRQSVRFCIAAEKSREANGRGPSAIRTLLPALWEQYRLESVSEGERELTDEQLRKLADAIFSSSREKAAEAVAAAISEGVSSEAIGEAISLAACHLVLRDRGRRTAEPGKPVGSVHGASIGVHASDSANAWRQISRVVNRRNRFASLIVGAFHTAGQTGNMDEHPLPLDEDLKPVDAKDPDTLISQLDQAVRDNNQRRATALVHRFAELNLRPEPVFNVLRKFAVSEDGELHAEKYYWTIVEEFNTMRPSVRWRQLCALARVTASEYGSASAGYQLAKTLLQG